MEVLVPISFFVSIAAVMILRPVSKKLGLLIESVARERNQPRAEDPTHAQAAVVLEHVMKRLDAIEERLDFTERLVAQRRQLESRGEPRLESQAEARSDLRLGFTPREHRVG